MFLSFFYKDTFELYINGNGGFSWDYLNKTFLNSIILQNERIFYYLLIFITTFLFLISINFELKKFFAIIKKIFTASNPKNYTDKNEIINEYIPQEEIKNLIQEDFLL